MRHENSKRAETYTFVDEPEGTLTAANVDGTARNGAVTQEVERYFSTAKRRNGMGVIKWKREDTSLSTIAMSILVTNIFGTFKLAVEEYENESSDSSRNQKRCKS